MTSKASSKSSIISSELCSLGKAGPPSVDDIVVFLDEGIVFTTAPVVDRDYIYILRIFCSLR